MRLTVRQGKFLRRTLVFVLLSVVLFFAGRYFLYLKIRDTIEKELASLQSQGVYISYDNIEVNPWAGELQAYKFTVKIRKDSVPEGVKHYGLEAYLPYVEVRGLEVIPFIKNRTLSIKEIYSHETNLIYTLQSTLVKPQSGEKRKIELQNIAVGNIGLPRIDLYLTDFKTEDTLVHVLTDINMQDLLLSKQLDSLTWRKGLVDVTNFAANHRAESYGVAVKRIHLDLAHRNLEVDSFFIKPSLRRDAFMARKGEQTNYMEARVPSLRISGIDWYTYPMPTLQLDRVDVSITTSMYRDKRLPFKRVAERPLPSHFLQRLPVRLQVDTILVKDSFVRYEEMPEQGDSSGVVYFENLRAEILMLHNNPKLPIETRMHAAANFMGAGVLDARFTFPYDTLKPYHVVGSLVNMPLPRVNRMLGAAAKAKVQTGVMNSLHFEFAYGPLKSTGSIAMNYENLRVVTLRQNNKNEQAVSVVKTFLLNTLIIRKDMNDDVKDDKRRGDVEFYRDPRRSIFNYWWKSILSGIKSAYKLDKLPINTSGKKKEKKKKGLKEAWSKIFDGDKKKK